MPNASLPQPIDAWRDRWSGNPGGDVVLDLGEQPASDLFPAQNDPTPDPRYRLRMVMGSTSKLLQIEADDTTPEPPIGIEPEALVRQAELCVADAAAAGFIVPGSRVLEYPSPHGGSWRRQLEPFDLDTVDTGVAELIIDVHGMMHAPDQRAAFLERLGHLADDGVLVMMIYNATSIIREGMWNALRNGHFAYYTTPVLVEMAGEIGLTAIGAWSYPLYNNGTTMLAFARDGSSWGQQSGSVTELIDEEIAQGVLDPLHVSALGSALTRSVGAIREYLDGAREAGLRVAGYGAASRTAALLTTAAVSTDDVTAIADASPAKQGRAMPGSRIPIISPAELISTGADRVLLFVSDLLPDVRAALPEIEASGARWVVVDPMPHEIEPLG